MPGGKRMKVEGPAPEWSDVRGLLHMRLRDAAAELKVPITYLRRLCRQNGCGQWPGKKVRYMNRIGIGKNLMLEADAQEGSSSRAGLAGTSQLANIVETQKEKEDDMTRTHEPAANPHPPRKELTTLNLIDKIGSSSSSERI